MLDIFFSKKNTRCDGHTRRDFLRLGAVGALGLPALLQAEANASAPAQPNRRAARARSVILVYLGGGLSHHDSFDPKPEAPEEIRGIYRPIASNVPGTQVGE